MAKVGRNDPCPCGSGKKYKNCCRELFRRMKHDDSYVFFPDKPDREKVDRFLEVTIANYMERVGAPPELIYAWRKTGRIVTDENMHLLSEEDLKEWQDAIEEYRRQNKGGEHAA